MNEEGEPGSHVACTVEMSNLAQPYEVAVIDEIQVILNILFLSTCIRCIVLHRRDTGKY